MKVLVYQMGKVGSASVHHSLLAHGGVDVEHVHEVDPDYVRNVRGCGPNSPESRRCARLRSLMTSDEPLKIITLVRDPISRNVSLLWENHGSQIEKYPGHILSFWKTQAHDEVLTWFDRELKQATGIDVYDYQFNQKLGWSVIQSDSRDVLILKCEADDAMMRSVISMFLSIDGFVLSCHNENRLPAYVEFCKRFKVSTEYAYIMETARYTKHFYSDAEIDSMRERWT